jgi:hypothetical protein
MERLPKLNSMIHVHIGYPSVVREDADQAAAAGPTLDLGAGRVVEVEGPRGLANRLP